MFPAKIENVKTTVLYDTGAQQSCMKTSFFKTLKNPPQLRAVRMKLVGATGTQLKPVGQAEFTVELGEYRFIHSFMICDNLGLTPDVILGLDAHRRHKMGLEWGANGKLRLLIKESNCNAAVNSVTCQLEGVPLTLVEKVKIPPRTIVMVEVQSSTPLESGFHQVQPISPFDHENDQIISYNMWYNVDEQAPKIIPLCLVNLGEEEAILEQGKVTSTITAVEARYLADDHLPMTPEGTKVITSPAEGLEKEKIHLRPRIKPPWVEEALSKMKKRHVKLFSKYQQDVGHVRLVTMDINTDGHPPVSQKPYTIPLKYEAWVRKELEMLEEAGIIQRSTSPWGAPIIIVPKRTEEGAPAEQRICVDFRVLNALCPPTVKANSNAKGILSAYPLPKIDQLLTRLHGAKLFSTIDLTSAYYHIGLSEEASEKSAFITPWGKWKFNRVPFGLREAPGIFQNLMDQILAGVDYAMAYLDDLIIFSSDSYEEHLTYLEEIMHSLETTGLKVKQSKCHWFVEEVQYLGHMISGGGIAPLPDKVTAMQDMTRPTTVTGVKSVLGFTNYYRKFIPRYADIVIPLVDLTRLRVPFIWSPKCQISLDMLKTALSSHPILKLPDPDKPYTMYTDASKYAYAGVLTQPYTDPEGDDLPHINHPITYVSGLFKGSQQNWPCLVKEAYACFKSIRRLYYYLAGAQVTLVSDHLPLKTFLHKETHNYLVNNWAVELSAYDIRFRFIKGKDNLLADSLSRLIEQGISEAQVPEPSGQEFGYYLFDGGKVKPQNIHEVRVIDPKIELVDTENITDVNTEQIVKGQREDPYCKSLLRDVAKGKNPNRFQIEPNGLLMKVVTEADKQFKAVVLPQGLVPIALDQGHDKMGHNGVARTHELLRRLYYWPSMRSDVQTHVKGCVQCMKENVRVQEYPALHLKVPSRPMDMIAMDLIGQFPTTHLGNSYALTCICMLTQFTFCVPIPNKTADTVAQAYIDNIYAKFGSSKWCFDRQWNRI